MSYVLGVDLGTTFTAAAVLRDGTPQIASLGSRGAAIPSVVLLREDETVLTGEAAERRAMTEPDRVAREFKRRLGDTTPILLAGSPYSAEALMSRLLRSVVDEVVTREGAQPDAITVTHPANWGEFKIDLLTQAIRLADVAAPVSLITEPVAAAIAYAAQQRLETGRVIAVFDLGGGTFDAAVLRRTETGFEILGVPEGIERLGGIDFDAAVFGHVARLVGDSLAELDEDDPTAQNAVARLRADCVDAKEALSVDVDASIPVMLPNLQTEVRLTRAEFEAMIRPSLVDAIDALRRALRSAGVEPDAIEAVLLVGGSSRIPLVAQLVGSELGRPVAVDAHPKHAVAIGAAVAAATDVNSVPSPPAPPQAAPEPAAPPAAAVPPEPAPPEPDAPPEAVAPEPAPPEPVAPHSDSPVSAGPRPKPALPPRPSEAAPADGPTPDAAPGAFADAPAEPAIAPGTPDTEERKSRRPLLIGAVVLLLVLVAAGAAALLIRDGNTPSALVLPEGEPVTIELWHPLRDEVTQPVLEDMIADFEAANPDISVTIGNTASYNNLLTDTVEAAPEDRPNVVLLAARAVQRVIDDLDTVSATTMIEQDDFEPDLLLPMVAAQYSAEDALLAMPFNSSVPVAYVNVDLTRPAGLNIDGVTDWTTGELMSACSQLQQLVETCFSYENGGWMFEQLIGNSGGDYFGSGNGRTAMPLKVAFDDAIGGAAFRFLVDGVASGAATGPETAFEDFVEGRSAILLTSSSSWGELNELVSTRSEPFELGAAWLPHLNGTVRNGTATAGGALWLMDTDDERERIASWLLMDHLSALPQQIAFHQATGYVPVRLDAVDDDDLLSFWEDNPSARVAFDQLRAAAPEDEEGEPNLSALGGLAGPMPQVRTVVNTSIEKAQAGELTVGEALDEAVTESERLLSEYAESSASTDSVEPDESIEADD